MIDRRQLISSRQLGTLIISAMTGVGIISLPNRLAKEVGHDGWIPIAASGIIAIIMALVIIKLLERYKDKSIFDINFILYGKLIGWPLNIIYILYLALKVAINLRMILEIIHTVVLKVTPPLILVPLLLFSTVYLSWYGLKSICRYANLIYPTIFMVILLLAANLKFVKPTFLMPVGESSIPSILNVMRATAYSFLAFAFPWVVYPMVTDKDKVLKHTILALIFSTIFFLLVVVVLTGFFGENTLKHLVFPLYSFARTYKAPVFERIDLFFLAIWFPAMGISLNAYFFVTNYWIDKLFRIKRKTISLIIFSICIVIISRIPNDIPAVNKYLEIADMVGIPLVCGMAIIGYILSFFKKKGVQKG